MDAMNTTCPYPLKHGKCPPAPDKFFSFGYSGVYTFAAVIAALGAYALYVWYLRGRSRQGKMSDIHAGGFRFAAAQGNVAALIHIKKNAPRFDVNVALHGWTAIHAAAIEGHAKVIRWLVDHGGDISAIKSDDWLDSVLHYAAANGHTQCVEVLLDVGADPSATNFEGATPADLAGKGGYGDLAKLLIEAAVDWIRSDSIRMTALQLKEEAEIYNDGLGSSFRREVAQLDRILDELGNPSPGPDAEGNNLSSIDKSGTTFNSLPRGNDVSDPSGRFSDTGSGSPPRANELEMTSLACEYRQNPAEPGNEVKLTVGVKTHPEPPAAVAKPEEPKPEAKPEEVKKEGELPAESWITANRSEKEGWASMRKDHTQEDERIFNELMNRGWEGLGTEGTQLRGGWLLFRASAIVCQSLGVIYVVWRACRTFNIEALWLSVPFYMAELVSFIPSFIFCLEVWCPSYRPPRHLAQMEGLSEADYPSCDIIIVCYSEPVDIVEATACAALNLNYPADKLTIYICDDGKKEAMRAMAHRLEFQRRYLKRQAPLVYVSRTKVKGVPHHAKAGNINNLLLKGGARGDFVVVFDCDMIPKPGFLMRTIPHFFSTKLGGGWKHKNRAGFLQTPQDFYNLEAKDPFGNRARFFYGPMMQGRDGVGSCPCVGTGVIFRREALISMGGQAYGSITEDYNSAMGLLRGGFSSMFLNELLIFGIAPDDIMTVLTQRQRWAMGSLQILCLDNPLTKGGLTIPQSLLFFQSCIQYTLSLPTLLMSLVPILFMFSGISPIHAKVHEFLVFFVGYYLANRIMLFLAHRGVPNAGMEMWRGSQQWVWLVPNNLVACWKAFSSELAIFKFFKIGKLGFTVTNKDGNDNWKQALRVTWPFFAYYIGISMGVVYTVAFVGTGDFTVEDTASRVVALAWGILVCMYIWPPVVGVFPWMSPGYWFHHGRNAPGGIVKWEADEALAASPKTPAASALGRPFKPKPSFKRGASFKGDEASTTVDNPAFDPEGGVVDPSAAEIGHNGLFMTRQQVIPVEDLELSILYKLTRKVGPSPAWGPLRSVTSMSPVTLSPARTTGRRSLDEAPLELPAGALSPGQGGAASTPEDGGTKLEQFRRKRGISLTALGNEDENMPLSPLYSDVAIDVINEDPDPIEDPEKARSRNALGALLTSRRGGPAAVARTPKSLAQRALDALALPSLRRAPAGARLPLSPTVARVMTPDSAHMDPQPLQEFYSLVTPHLHARTGTSPQLKALSTPRSGRTSPKVFIVALGQGSLRVQSPLEGRSEKEWPVEDNDSVGFQEFKEQMTTRATYSDHATLEARPVFELEGAKMAGGKGMRPHLIFMITNALLLVGFIVGGVIYVWKLSLDDSWLGMH